jgi:hypothetical protein
MTDLGVSAVHAAVELPAGDQTGADAGSNRHQHKGLRALSCSPRPLSQSGCVGVILKGGGHAERFRQRCHQVGALPAGQKLDPAHLAGERVDRPCTADADALQIRACLGEHIL